MTTETLHVESQGEPEIEAHRHPGVRQYVTVGVVLAVVTFVEVALYYLPDSPVTTPALLLFGAIKFFLVVSWFMHLRFDSPLFSGIFVFGLVVAAALMLALIALYLGAPVHHALPGAVGLGYGAPPAGH